MRRHQVSTDEVGNRLLQLATLLTERRLEKGDGIFVSSHEILGCLIEEVDELREAVHNNNLEEVSSELLDIAVGALWGYISVKSGKMDWPKAEK